jgi:protein-S-isoprenylcysteine O-methyltransferase Ste14
MDDSFTIVEFTRIYLAVFYSFVAAFYALRITAKKRRDPQEVVFPGVPFCSTWWNHMLFRVFRLTIWMVCLFRWFFPAVDTYLGIFVDLNTWSIVLVGNTLLTAGFLFTVLVHLNLGHQWRSGIDPCGPGKLRTAGFYKYSRNPMFLGVATAQAGFFLALPSVFSGVCLLVGLYTLHKQTLAEEAHLSSVFPADYKHYRGRVRRWL